MYKISKIVAILLLLSGCVTNQPLLHSQIIFEDGINEREAIAIARNFVLNNPDLSGIKPNSGGIHYQDDKKWYVRMYLNSNNEYGKIAKGLLAYLIVIDKKTGEILQHTYDK